VAVSIPVQSAGDRQPSHLSPSAALRHAWVWYLALGFIPFGMALAIIAALSLRDGPPAPMSVKSAWFIGAILFQLIVGPIAFVVRSRMFRSYWQGHPVDSRTYLRGMLVVWMAFEIGGLLSLLGCFMSNSLVPCLLPAIAAFMFFASLYPNGRAMSRPIGNTDDPEIYEEPR